MLKPSVQIREQDGILVAEFWDCLRLDPVPVQELRKAFEAHHQRNGRPEVVVDLSGVGFAGSAALGGFLALRRLGARLVFCNVEPTVREVFRVSKLEPLFVFASDPASAIEMALKNGTDPSRDPSPADESAKDPSPSPTRSSPGSAPLRRGRDRMK